MINLALRLYIALSAVIIATIIWPQENPVTNLIGSMPLIGYVLWACPAVIMGMKLNNAELRHFIAAAAGFAPLIILVQRIPVAL